MKSRHGPEKREWRANTTKDLGIMTAGTRGGISSRKNNTHDVMGSWRSSSLPSRCVKCVGWAENKSGNPTGAPSSNPCVSCQGQPTKGRYTWLKRAETRRVLRLSAVSRGGARRWHVNTTNRDGFKGLPFEGGQTGSNSVNLVESATLQWVLVSKEEKLSRFFAGHADRPHWWARFYTSDFFFLSSDETLQMMVSWGQ